MRALDGWKRQVREASHARIERRTRAGRDAMEALLDDEGSALFTASGAPGLVVALRFSDGSTTQRTFGAAGPGTPMRADAVFQVFSVSKPVTALVAMRLVERGVLHLDEPVWRKIRSWRLPPHRATSQQADAVTLRRLLSHSAGLNVLGYGVRAPGETPTAAALLAREEEAARTLRVVRPAGTFGYSGGGFVLVQLLVEDATGRRYADVARETVLEPLGMRSSDFDPRPDLLARLAVPHDANGRSVASSPYAATAASGLYSTADDLLAFWSSFLPGPRGEPPGRGVVSPATCDRMLDGQVVDRDGTWGLGFRLKTKRGDQRYVHAGYDAGWHVYAEGLRRRRVAFALLCNGQRGEGCVPPLSRAMRLRLYELPKLP